MPAGALAVRKPAPVCPCRRGPWGACGGTAGAIGIWRKGGRVQAGGHFVARTPAALPASPEKEIIPDQVGDNGKYGRSPRSQPITISKQQQAVSVFVEGIRQSVEGCWELVEITDFQPFPAR